MVYWYFTSIISPQCSGRKALHLVLYGYFHSKSWKNILQRRCDYYSYTKKSLFIPVREEAGGRDIDVKICSSQMSDGVHLLY